MKDFAELVQTFTCIGDETKQKIIYSAKDLSDEKKAKVIEVLKKGEEKKKALKDAFDTKMLEHVEKHLKEVDDFKRGPLRKAFREAEEFDHTAEAKAAEDLLKDL